MSGVQGQGQGQDTGRRRRIAEVIGAALEAITRFKAADLKELLPDQASAAELVVTTRQRIELDIDTVAHPGRLPPGTLVLTDAAAVVSELQQRLATAEALTATRIQQWATEEPGRYRRLLPAGRGLSAGLEGLEEMVGAEWACTLCAQRGRLACTGCAGRGAQVCPDCQGQRRGACRQCRGLGRLACGACGGRGQDQATQAPCAACSQGWLGCTACDGQGEQDCARCAATGQVTCPDCAGQQWHACPECAATGWRHQRGCVRERLEIEDRLDIHHPDAAIAEAIASRLTEVTTLLDTCTLEQVRYTTAPLAVQAVQRLKLPVWQAQLLVAGQPMRFTALGPALEILDHQHVAALLLAHDLSTLEKNAAGSGRHLGDALQRFLQSPLNREIAARTPPAEIDRRHPGMADKAYQARALAAAQRAIERLWLQRAWRPRLLCLAGIGGVAALAVAVGSPRIGLWTGAALALALGVVAWVVADWQMRRQLANALRIPDGDRLLRPLRHAAAVRRWQAVSLAAAAVVALTSAGAMTRLPHVRQHTAQAQATAVLAPQLDAWLVSEGKDFRLRRYPDAAALAQAAGQASADPRARLVRAWQVLLGTDGVAADPRAAEPLLEGLPAQLERLERGSALHSAAVIGQARATLELHGRSAAALQTAATALDALPAPPMPEALYTLALVQLTPVFAARVGGLQTGLTTLQQAADLGHASACYALGRRLASGTGLRRDLAGARRYLGYAEAKGVPGAAQALAALR